MHNIWLPTAAVVRCVIQSLKPFVFLVFFQRKPEDPPIDLVEGSSEFRTSKHTKRFSIGPSAKPPPSSSSPGGCASRLSPCCRSPAPRSHLKSTPCTPCPEPSPAVAAPRSPALSPHATPHHLPKPAESQDKRGEGQPPQDYPQSLEPGEWENDSIHVCYFSRTNGECIYCTYRNKYALQKPANVVSNSHWYDWRRTHYTPCKLGSLISIRFCDVCTTYLMKGKC